LLADNVEFDPIDEGFVTDGASVSGSPAKCIDIDLPRQLQICLIDGGEGD